MNVLDNLLDNPIYLILFISAAVITPVVFWYYGFYHPSIIGIYESMTCAELKDMLINSAEGLGPIFRGVYARCIA